MSNLDNISILGSGWLGLPLAHSLQNSGQKVCVSTRSLTKAKELSEQGLVSTIVDIESPSMQLQDFLKADTLIINITSKSYSAFQSLSLDIEKSPVKHVLFVSSTSVYGNDQGLCKETDHLHIETNLRKIEKLFMENKNFDCTIIRFAGLIGRKRHPGRFFATGKAIKDANAKVNLIHQLDCIKLIETILNKAAWGEVFNACADSHPNKKEFYGEMARSLGYHEPISLITEPSSTKVICNEKIKKYLGYTFVYPDLYHINW